MRSAKREPTPTSSASCARGWACWSGDEPAGELDLMPHAQSTAGSDLPPTCVLAACRRRRVASPPCSSSTCFPTADRKVDLFPAALDPPPPMGLYRYQPDPRTERYPLALISPASERTISSTLGELPRPDVKLVMHPTMRRRGGWRDNDLVRVFNQLGEVHCLLTVAPWIRRGTVTFRKASGAAARATTRPGPRWCRTRHRSTKGPMLQLPYACRWPHLHVACKLLSIAPGRSVSVSGTSAVPVVLLRVLRRQRPFRHVTVPRRNRGATVNRQCTSPSW